MTLYSNLSPVMKKTASRYHHVAFMLSVTFQGQFPDISGKGWANPKHGTKLSWL